jgi:hypothetical protein
MANTTRYSEYFDIDDKYFPQVNESSIADDPDCWKRTFPHQTFIEMLRSLERCMSRLEKRSLWIQGAYGVGKSQCAYTLKKLLEVPETELNEYWNGFKPLEKYTGLLESLKGHRDGGIVTVYRYATADISTPRHFYIAVQESVRAALRAKALNEGENTLKESIIAWIEKPANKNYLNDLLQQPEYSAKFAQSTADEVLTALRKNGSVSQIMNDLFFLADREDIQILNFNVDRLIAWLSDVIDVNNIKIVFVWDQFGDYFERTGGDKEDTFQKLCELVNHKAFFFIPVTHEGGAAYIKDNNAWKAVRDRFVEHAIALPPNIAFHLVGHALKKNPSALGDWSLLAEALNNSVSSARSAVMKEIGVTDSQVIKDIMPLHPMAALLLKNIASAFKSNQRSMFDFIKSTDTEYLKAFQWFIKEKGPQDGHPLLTVDMLWNFFYEKGKDNLTSDIRLILDTFPQQTSLREDEKAVLKTILIMQAIDQRTGGTIELFKTTDQNLKYVYDGIYSGLDTACVNIAKGLVSKGILVYSPISGNRHVYAAAVLAGDQAKIDGYKKDIRQSGKTAKLVADGGLSTVLQLSPPLRLRYEAEPGSGKLIPVTPDDFTRTINGLREKPSSWNFYAVIAFAKDDAEAVSFRKLIKIAVADEQYKNIIFIDALSTPLNLEAFETYVDFSAMAMYYQGNNNKAANENSDKARRVLDQDWRNRLYNGQFIVYTYKNQEGENLANGNDVATTLQTIVMARFPYVFDFVKGLSESVLRVTPAMRQSAKSGICQVTSRPGDKSVGGVVVGIESKVFPKDVWNTDRYWETAPTLHISRIKVDIDKLIETAFARGNEGRISIGELYDFLEEKYGFAPCNLSAFLTGFLLKEYSGEPYRSLDVNGKPDPMVQDKLAEMLANYIGKPAKPTYIVKMTANEMAFYDLTEKAWHIPQNSCASVSLAVQSVIAKMRGFGLPVWCLAEVDDYGAFDIVQQYIELVQLSSDDAHSKAMKIGEVAQIKTTLAEHLNNLLTVENCQNGMRKFLKTFEGGKVLSLAIEIGAGDNVLSDIRDIFKVEYACCWQKSTGEDAIRRLLVDYGIVKETNDILNAHARSKVEAFREWREKLRFVGISQEAIKAKYTILSRIFETLLKICKQDDILPDKLKEFHSELSTHSAEICDLLNNINRAFAEIYEPYLDGLNENDVAVIKSNIGTGLFELPKSDCNIKIKDAVDKYRKTQLRTQVFAVWREKTGTKSPRDWSSRYRTPILSCVSESEFDMAKKAFDVLNGRWAPDNEILSAIEFLNATQIYDVLASESKRNAAFVRDIIGEYRTLLPNIEDVRDALERLTDPYDWRGNPSVENKIKQLAEAEYSAGGSDKVLAKIDKMSDAELKKYLRNLVCETKNIKAGIAIIAEGGE